MSMRLPSGSFASVSLLLFLSLALLAIFVRHADPFAFIQIAPDHGGVLDRILPWPIGLRIGVLWVEGAIEWAARAISRVFIFEPDTFPLYQGTPWPKKTLPLEQMETYVIPFFKIYGSKLLFLFPIWLCVRSLFQFRAQQLFAIVVIIK